MKKNYIREKNGQYTSLSRMPLSQPSAITIWGAVKGECLYCIAFNIGPKWW